MTQMYAVMINMIDGKQSQRNWKSLPPSFETDAVRAIFQKIKPHFTKDEIKQRIKASKAITWMDLRNAIN